MPVFEHAGVSLYYEEYGSGYPLLLFAPGGMRSSIDFWRRSPFDPTAELAQDFRVIAMDQRNAGRSRAPPCIRSSRMCSRAQLNGYVNRGMNRRRAPTCWKKHRPTGCGTAPVPIWPIIRSICGTCGTTSGMHR